jgi:uncharacterized membrane protein
MNASIMLIIGYVGLLIEVLGVVVIVIGIAVAVGRYGGRYFRGSEAPLYEEFRREVGRSLMVGLEFLVAGDIVRTVIISHSIADVAALGLLVLVRTVLVFTIHLEVEGRWPWQRAAAVVTGTAGGGSEGS